jgi:hypothetical protein
MTVSNRRLDFLPRPIPRLIGTCRAVSWTTTAAVGIVEAVVARER